MDDHTIRVAVGLYLGTLLCNPNVCRQCGGEVDILETHGLSCSRSKGRHFRHAALNDTVHRSMISARVPAWLEPTCIGPQRNDGKRPDGVTMVPWLSSRQLVWDVTTPDTFAPSYIVGATSEAGTVVALAEENKAKYISLAATYSFCPIAIETSGVLNWASDSNVCQGSWQQPS